MYRDGGEELLVDDNARELFVSEELSPRTVFIPITILDSDEENPPSESETYVFADVVATYPRGWRRGSGGRLARRARSFKEDLIDRLTQMKTPGTPSASSSPSAAGTQSPLRKLSRGMSPKGKSGTGSPVHGMATQVVLAATAAATAAASSPSLPQVRSSIGDMDSLIRKLNGALRYFQDAIGKKAWGQVPGSATIILETVIQILATLESSVATSVNRSSVIMSANNQVNESVARLIQWSDETLLMQENEGHELLKENTAQVVQEVIDAVKRLVEKTEERLNTQNRGMSMKNSYGQVHGHSHYNPNMNPCPCETSLHGHRNSLPEIPLPMPMVTPDYVNHSAANSKKLAHSQSTDSILDTRSFDPMHEQLTYAPGCGPPPPPPKPPLNLRYSTCNHHLDSGEEAPPLPPKRRQQRNHSDSTMGQLASDLSLNGQGRYSPMSGSPRFGDQSGFEFASLADSSRCHNWSFESPDWLKCQPVGPNGHSHDSLSVHSTSASSLDSAFNQSMDEVDFRMRGNSSSSNSLFSNQPTQDGGLAPNMTTWQEATRQRMGELSIERDDALSRDESGFHSLQSVRNSSGSGSFHSTMSSSSMAMSANESKKTSFVSLAANQIQMHRSHSGAWDHKDPSPPPPALPVKKKTLHERAPSHYDNICDLVDGENPQFHWNLQQEKISPTTRHREDNEEKPPLPPKKKPITTYMALVDSNFVHRVQTSSFQQRQSSQTSTSQTFHTSSSYSIMSRSLSSFTAPTHSKKGSGVNGEPGTNGTSHSHSPSFSLVPAFEPPGSQVPPALPPKKSRPPMTSITPPPPLKPPSPGIDNILHASSDKSLAPSPSPLPAGSYRIPSPTKVIPLREPTPLDLLDVSDQLIYKNPRDDGPEIRGGSPDVLTVHATKDSKTEFDYQEAFVTTYRTFITPGELVSKLIYRYKKFHANGDPIHQRAAKSSFSLLIRVVDDLAMMDLDDGLLRQLMDFEQSLLTAGELIQARALRTKFLERWQAKQRACNPQAALPTLSTSIKQSVLLDFKSFHIAEQMTLLDAELFVQLEPTEILIWAREQNEELSPNLTHFTEQFNNLSYWARSLILQQHDAKDRDKCILKFIKVMRHLRKLNNFNSYWALSAALVSAPICRLEWQKQITEGVKEYLALIDSSGSFRMYRQVLADTQPPCIPYIGLILSDLTFIHVGNPDFLPNGAVNFAKRWQQYRILKDMKRFRKCQYNIKKNEKIVSFFNGYKDHMTEEEMWQISESIKPRGGGNKKN